jgi:hypothetical protein
MFCMLFFGFGIDQGIINENNNKLVELWYEHGVH